MVLEVKPQEYWLKRSKARSSLFQKAAASDFRYIQNEYKNSLLEMKEKLDAFYGKYGTVKGNTIVITQNDAFQLMSRQERRSFQRKAEKVRDKIINTSDEGFKIRLGKYINNKKQFRKNDLDLDQEYSIHKVFQAQDENYDSFLRDVILSAYVLTQFDVVRGLNFKYNINSDIKKRTIDKMINYPWSGKTFSERIWANKEKLASTLKEVTTRGFLQGQPLGKMAGDIADRMGVSKRHASRLLYSETTHSYFTSCIEAYKDSGFKKLQVVSVPSDHWHWTKIHVNGHVFTIGTPEQAYYTPPIEYPGCKCDLIPLKSDNDIMRLWNFGEIEGETISSFQKYKDFNNKTIPII